MGFYIDPLNETKEEFLKREGFELHTAANFNWDRLPDSMLPVVLVSNVHFTAAGICFNYDEYLRFNNPGMGDIRPKRLFLVPKDKLKIVAPALKGL